MPNFGFNPFAPRINVFTTGVDQGDSRRYYSRDVIRIGGERVEIDATLTPGEPGHRQQSQFEKQVSDMVKNESDFVSGKDKKLEFVSGETIQSNNPELAGVKSLEEYKNLKKEESRREELSRYQLKAEDIETIIQFERSLPDEGSTQACSSPMGSASIPSDIRDIYDRIELKKQYLESSAASASAAQKRYSESVDMQANDFISLQRIHNPFLDTSSNKLLQMAKEGIYETHLPRPDLSAVLQYTDEEYAKQHPIIRDVLHKPSKTDFSKEQKLNKRVHVTETDREVKKKKKTTTTNLSKERGEPKQQIDHKTVSFRHITDEEIDRNRLSEEELASLKPTKEGSPNNTLYVRNLPPNVSREELVDLFGRFEKSTGEFVYTLLTGRMKGQAFITFPDLDTAEKVKKQLHGFVLDGKPLLLQYKR